MTTLVVFICAASLTMLYFVSLWFVTKVFHTVMEGQPRAQPTIYLTVTTHDTGNSPTRCVHINYNGASLATRPDPQENNEGGCAVIRR